LTEINLYPQNPRPSTCEIDPKEIGFDIDGVVADTTEAFLRLARKDFSIYDIEESNITEFDVSKCLPIADEIVEEIFARLLKDPIGAGMRPMPHAVEVLEAASRKARLTFITARPLARPIDAWLAHHLPAAVYKKVNLVACGEHDGKVPHIKEHNLRFFVDDRAETCQDLGANGITPLVFKQPWNIGRHHLQSVSGWLEIGDRLSLK